MALNKMSFLKILKHNWSLCIIFYGERQTSNVQVPKTDSLYLPVIKCAKDQSSSINFTSIRFLSMKCGVMLYDLNNFAVSVVKLCAFVLDRCASAVVQMATLQCGTFTTRLWFASSKATQTVHHVLTFLQMEPNYGQVD
jgi:hypothetical protein